MSLFSSIFGAPSRVTGSRARILVSEGALLMDVRTPAEFESGHVDGAVNIPVGLLPTRLHELDPSRPVVIYCRSGGRSGSASKLLRNAGFHSVYDLGPMHAW